MDTIKKLLTGGVFLLLSILVIGCKKDEDDQIKPLTLSIIQQDGKALDQQKGITFTQGSTLTFTLAGIESYEVVASDKEVVAVVVNHAEKTVTITGIKAGNAVLRILYRGNNQEKTVAINVAVTPKLPAVVENPTGLFKDGNLIMPFGYVARKPNTLFLSEKGGSTKYIKLVLQGDKAQVTSNGFTENAPSGEFLKSDFGDKFYKFSNDQFTIVILKSTP